MEPINLKYGQGRLSLTQSDALIGVRPQRNRDADARAAVDRVLGGVAYEDQGLISGFRILHVDPYATDADKALDVLRADASIQVGTHVFESPGRGGQFVPTGDIFIEFAAASSEAERQALIDAHALSIKEARGARAVIAAVTRESANPVKVAAALQGEEAVEIAEPDLASRAALKAPASDPLQADQWHLRNTGFHRNTSLGFLAGADARVFEAWAVAGTRGRADVVVAVIDDGFDLGHPDLSTPGKVVHPWDFTRKTDKPIPDQGDWHGTACAGVAVAARGGGGVLGAAPDCSLMPVRWGLNLADAQIEAWFGYVTDKGASVVSCSWGALNPNFPLSTRAWRAIEKCATEGRGGLGCVVVFAAGNENSDVNDPDHQTVSGFATHPRVIAVAASNSRDQRSTYSNFGKEISICAPSSGAGGWGILTSDVMGVVDDHFRGYAEGDYTYDFGGTSSACPLVAGIAALVLSVSPGLTSAQVKTLFQDTARRIGPAGDYVNGHSIHFGAGCVNAAEAVKAILPTAQPAVARALGARQAALDRRPTAKA